MIGKETSTSVASANGMTVSVIIPTFRNWPGLNRCLVALKAQEYPRERIEIIVVNNDPADEPDHRNDWPENVTLISEAKPGSYAARNAGLSVATGGILAFTDSDCIPVPTWISSAVEHFATTDVSRIGGEVTLTYPNPNLNAAEIYQSVFEFHQRRIVEQYRTSVTANMFSRREVFEAIGPFDESRLSLEDIEWGKRAAAKGYSIDYVSAAEVLHPARRTVGELIRKEQRMAGGLLAAGVSSRLGILFRFLRGFLPPLKPLVRCLSNPMPFRHRVVAYFMRWFLRMVTAVEFLRIAAGGMRQRL